MYTGWVYFKFSLQLSPPASPGGQRIARWWLEFGDGIAQLISCGAD
jgi:hypothetical protein